MKSTHRRIHRWMWLFLLPLLLALIRFGADTGRESMPVNEEVPGLDGLKAPLLEHRVLP